ncbi:A24 family peptidase [Novosphingobium sp. Gsoil 351]|uniref:prepilin peptidase n=1 Tax=Novosphingobium sp. Gsoil 351 TaxID=2675225 RepID=UPI0012B4EC4B|nr:A24 family peptidase [Novosphingobium sp. Gsoil 351]QGN53933.1 prepilin peptidase [Novosphingobium sp. Gsoil 351]
MALLGAIVGSFLGAALIRLPKGESVVAGRSRCDCCGRVLGPSDLIPIVSFVMLRGRCSACGGAIDPWQFAAEPGGAMVGIVAALFARDGATLGLGLILGWQLLLLGLLDLRHLWLPDRLVLLLAATGLVFSGLAAVRHPVLLAGPLLGAVLGFGILWLAATLYRGWRGREGLGAGDPKLLGGIGLWLGPLGVVETLLAASLLGLIAVAGLMLTRRAPAADTALPLGTLLALAGFAVYLAQN